MRHDSHTIKVYFIGVLLQQIIDRNLSIRSELDTNYPFNYLWYLCCLFHDYGYRFEKQPLSEMHYSRMRKINTLNKQRFRNFRLEYYRILNADIKFVSPNLPFKKKCYLSSSLNKSRKKMGNQPIEISEICNNQCNGYIYLSNGKIVEKNHYSNRIKNNYFKYIIFERNHMEHGISGADYLFFKLAENYRNKCNELANRADSVDFIDEFNRRFHCEQFKIFAYIADCIACHNIWKAPEGSEELYKAYQLESLISEQFKIVSYEDNPLIFILCLSDSIEPTKKINDLSESEVLKNIDFDYCNKYNKLKVLISKEMSKNIKCEEYIKSLNTLESWIDIKMEVILV